MADFDVTITAVGDGIGMLAVRADPRAQETAVRDAVVAAVEQAFTADRLRRIEADLPATDRIARYALIRAGFRLEGRRREVVRNGDDLVDELIFSRLAGDVIGGAHGFSAVANSTMPRKRLIAHVLMRDEAGRVLLCQTAFKEDWELPGGIVEVGESPRLGAIREMQEELGIERELGALLAVDWMPPYLGWEDALELIFDGGTVTEQEIASFRLDPREIIAVRLIDLADAEPHLTPLSYRRLSAITSLDVPRTLTMEAGRPL